MRGERFGSFRGKVDEEGKGVVNGVDGLNGVSGSELRAM